MKRKLSEFDLQAVIFFQFLDTPGDEIAPGSNEIRENFEDERFRHDRLLLLVQVVQAFRTVQIVQRLENIHQSILRSLLEESQRVFSVKKAIRDPPTPS
jgi:hypothetical protein